MTDPISTIVPPIKIPDFKEILAPAIPKIEPPAKWMYERIIKQISDFEASLDPSEEVGARLVAAPGEGVLHFEDLGYWGPDMLIFHGRNEHGRPVQVLQHHSQLNLTLTALPVEDREPKRVGFVLLERLKASL